MGLVHSQAGFASVLGNDQRSELTADYTLTIATQPIELARNRIVSVTTYNGQFPGLLLRFKESVRVTADVHNETDIPEQLHWHGQSIPSDVDGAAEEGTPFIPRHGRRRVGNTGDGLKRKRACTARESQRSGASAVSDKALSTREPRFSEEPLLHDPESPVPPYVGDRDARPGSIFGAAF
jgi:hypothetical protein